MSDTDLDVDAWLEEASRRVEAHGLSVMDINRALIANLQGRRVELAHLREALLGILEVATNNAYKPRADVTAIRHRARAALERSK